MSNDDLLKAIGQEAYEHARELDDACVNVLWGSAQPLPEAIRWTEYQNGVYDTTNGARREAPFQALADDLAAYAKTIVRKGSGRWLMGALSKNGGCRDADIEAVTLLIFDCDGGGDWQTIRARLEEARLAYLVQRSSSHSPALPKWHLIVPLAEPWLGKKSEWRCIWRFLVGWFSAAAQLTSDASAAPPTYGFDPKTDRLGQPSFPAARRDRNQPPPETCFHDGQALDLAAFLDATGYKGDVAPRLRAEPIASPGAYECAPEHGLLALAFSDAGLLRHRVERGEGSGYAVVCPTEHLHSGARRERDDSTIVFDPIAGSTKGFLHCKHRCGNRDADEALKLLPEASVARARAQWLASVRATYSSVNTRTDRPKILVTTDEHVVNDLAIAALAKRDNVYQMGSLLVQIARDARSGAPRISPIAPARLRELLADVVQWVRLEKAKDDALIEIPAHPPEWAVRAIHVRDVWKAIRPLVGVIEAPALRADGSIIQTDGYDDATGLVYLPSETFPPVAETPTRAEVDASREALLEVVHDFPFANATHRAAWVALLLTLFARPAISGCVPMAAIDATTRGTGKGKLADATSNIFTGRDASKTPQPKDDEEMRKRITALLLEGEKIIVLDNIARPIGDPSLDACLTATVWKDRALGKNTTLSAPNLAVWIATGNNLQFAGDTARRTLHIRLESPVENPEDREGFRHPNLLDWVRANRARLVRAALTILRAYFVAGCPDMGCKSWGSFEEWSRVVANCAVWAGLEDPQKTRIELEAASDASRNGLSGLLRTWEKLQEVCGAERCGLVAGNVIKILYPGVRPGVAPPPDAYPFYADAREAIEALTLPSPGKPPSAQKLGMHLHHARRRVIGGRMFDRVGDASSIAKWRVVSADGVAPHVPVEDAAERIAIVEEARGGQA